MLFHQVRICTFLMSFLLGFWDFFGVSRDVFAQSILSDRVWLEQQIKAFIEKERSLKKLWVLLLLTSNTGIVFILIPVFFNKSQIVSL